MRSIAMSNDSCGKCSEEQLCSVFGKAFQDGEVNTLKSLVYGHQNCRCACCGSTLLHLAVGHRSVKFAQYYIDSHVELEARNDHGETALHVSCVIGDPQLVECLLNNDADFKASDLFGNSPLQLCLLAGNCSREVLSLLLAKGAWVNHLFAEQCNNKDIDLVIDGFVEANVNSAESFGKRPLSIAVCLGDKEATRRLLRRGACLQLGCYYSLHEAAFHGSLGCLNVLLEAGADVNQVDSGYRTALHYAVLGGDERVLALLLQQRDDCKCDSVDLYGHSPLDLALVANQRSMVKLLLIGNGATRFQLQDQLLYEAAEDDGSEEIVRMIVEHGYNPNAKNRQGDCLLSLAIERGNDRRARFLLDHGADANARVRQQNSMMLHLAVARNNIELVRMLLTRGANPNSKDGLDRTPLSLAAELDGREIGYLIMDIANRRIIDEAKHQRYLKRIFSN